MQRRFTIGIVSTVDPNKKQVPLRNTLKSLKPFLIPQDKQTRKVLRNTVFLISINKAVQASIPFIMKFAVNSVAVSIPSFPFSATLVVSFAMAKIVAVGTNELKSCIGTQLIQNSMQKIARASFKKLHEQEFIFHLQYGKEKVFTIHRAFDSFERMSRIITNMLGPLCIEFGVAFAILGIYCGPSYVISTAATLALYTGFTNWYSEKRRRWFRDMRK